jgi:hypothetical protein
MSHCRTYDFFKVGDIALVEVLPRSEQGRQLRDEIGFRLCVALPVDLDHELSRRHVEPPHQRRYCGMIDPTNLSAEAGDAHIEVNRMLAFPESAA